MASYLCNGSVNPSRFVKGDPTQTGGGYVIQCVGSDRPIGISQPGVRQPPINLLDDGFAGVAGINEIEVIVPGEHIQECWLESGAAVSAFDYLKPDGSGRGITAGSDGDQYGAIAQQAATAVGQLIRVRLLIGYRGA